MIPVDLLPLRATLRRRTAAVLSARAVPFSAVLTRADTDPVVLTIIGRNITANVAVHIDGELVGVPQTEDLTLTATAAWVARTASQWTMVTGVSAGAGSGTVEVVAVYADGQPAPAEAILSTSLRGRIDQVERPSQREQPEGTVYQDEVLFYCNDALVLGDRIDANDTRYEVIGTDRIYDHTSVHHSESRLKRLHAL